MPRHALAGEVRLRAVDLDNNGAFDLLLVNVWRAGQHAAGALIWLADENDQFTLLASPQGPVRVFDAAPASAEGRLDLLGLTADGQPIDAVNRATTNYHWQVIRPRAHQATGDQRINSFGIGGRDRNPFRAARSDASRSTVPSSTSALATKPVRR